MKYILVIDHIATGGAERILIDYYHYLKQNGHVPYVFVLSQVIVDKASGQRM